MKRMFCAAIAFVAGVIALQQFSGEASSQEKKKKVDKGPAPYVHAVIFYLKKDAPPKADERMIEDAHKLLAKIPSVRSVRAGHPAGKHTKIAVTDYEVGLLVIFDNYEGLSTYLEHDLHNEYLKRHEKHIAKVLVYDFVDGK